MVQAISTDFDVARQTDGFCSEAPCDHLLVRGPAARPGATTLLRRVLEIQGESTLLRRAERLAEVADDLIQADGVAVAVLDETGEGFEVAAACGRLLGIGGPNAASLDDLIGTVTRSGQACLLDDATRNVRPLRDDPSAGVRLRSWLGVPLLRPTGAFGALVVADGADHAFGPDQEETLSELAMLASAALADAHALEVARRLQDGSSERERRFRDFAEVVASWFWELDEHLRFTWFSSSDERATDAWPQVLVGKTWRESGSLGVSEAQMDRLELDLSARRPFRDFRFRHLGGDGNVWTLSASGKPLFDARGAFRGYRGSIADLSLQQAAGVATAELDRAAAERARMESALATRSCQQTALADLGQMALSGGSLHDVLAAAAHVVAGMLEADCSQVLRLRPDGSMLLLEAGLAWSEGLVTVDVVESDPGSQVGYALAVGEPVIVADLAHEDRFRPLRALQERGMVSGILVPIARPGRTYGLLGAHAGRAVQFADEDLQFLRSVANILVAAIEATQSQHLTEALVDQAPDLIARLDADLRFLSANLAVGVTFGRPVAELLGQTIHALGLMPSPQLDACETIAHSVFRNGRAREIELNWPTAHGDRDYHLRFVPELGTGRQVESLLVVARDVTEQKRLLDRQFALNEELLERDRQLRELIGSLQVDRLEERAQDRRHADVTFIASQLTAREMEILRLVVDGLTNQQIAARLHLSAGTVRNRLGLLFPKLDVVNRAQAAARVVELGLVNLNAS
jgi:GAF domain-containing protein/DNA-binding CsgD family transcriptional regulator